MHYLNKIIRALVFGIGIIANFFKENNSMNMLIWNTRIADVTTGYNVIYVDILMI